MKGKIPITSADPLYIMINTWGWSHTAIYRGNCIMWMKWQQLCEILIEREIATSRGGVEVVRTGVMRSDLGFVEHGQTWLLLLYTSVLSSLELSQDEKITRGERRRIPTKRWKLLRSLAQADGGEDERRAKSKRRVGRGGENKEKCVTGILFVKARFTKPVASDTRCFETDWLRYRKERRNTVVYFTQVYSLIVFHEQN